MVTLRPLAFKVNVTSVPLSTLLSSRPVADTLILGSVPAKAYVSASALAGTTTRLRTNVRANSKERNFFM